MHDIKHLAAPNNAAAECIEDNFSMRMTTYMYQQKTVRHS